MTAQMASRWICRIAKTQMRNRCISRRTLAIKMGVSPAYITKLLKGNENMTFQLCEKLASALQMKFQANLIL